MKGLLNCSEAVGQRKRGFGGLTMGNVGGLTMGNVESQALIGTWLQRHGGFSVSQTD